jgi:nucleolar protein 56
VAGIFEFEDGKLKKHELFKKDPKFIADKLENSNLEHLEDFREISKEVGFVKDDQELNELLNRVGIEMTKRKISKLGRRDKLIIETVSALNDMDKLLNFMSERLREWYGLHYPELNVKDHERFAELIEEFGDRKNFKDFKSSIGIELKKGDIEMLKEYAEQTKKMYELRKELQEYLEKIVPEEIPNINALLGSVLAARLLNLAGSLEKIAKMPSSTIQLLGAEKALFKYLKGQGKKTPKYGIIFTHPDISTAPKESKGKIARLLASKLTLAARADFYSKKDMSKSLLEDYKNRLKKIK